MLAARAMRSRSAVDPPGADAPYARTLVILCLAGVLVVGQLYAVIPILSELARSWSTTAAAAGWTATSFGLGYAAGFLLFGPLADRFDPRRVLVVGLAGTAAATVAVALSPTLAWGNAARVLQGLVAATFAPAAFAYVARHIPQSRRVAATTWLTSFFIASAVLGQLYSQLVSGIGGWRAVFGLSAAGFVGCALLMRAVLRPDHAPAAASAAAAYRAMAGLVTRPVILLLLGATVTVLGSFVAVYAALQLAGPAGLAGSAGALLALRATALPAMLIVPLVIPVLVRLPPARRVSTALALAAAVAGVTAILATGAHLTVSMLTILLFPFAFAVAVAAPALVGVIGGQSGGARAAAVALYTFTLFVGASLGPPLASALLDTSLLGGGFAGVLAVLVVVLAAGATLANLAHRTIERSAP